MSYVSLAGEYLNFSSKNKLPVLLQSEASECGLACLVMAAGFYGHDLDMPTARTKFNVSLKGLTISGMVDIAEKLHLQARAVRLELEDLDKLKCPAVLHWDLNHFVVLKRCVKGGYIIHDPARGKILLSEKDVSNHFTGVAVELTPTKLFEKKEETKPVKLSDFWGRMHGVKKALINVFLLSVFLQVFVISGPLLQQLVIDDAIVKQDENLLIVLILGFFMLNIFQTAVTYIRSKLVLYFTNTLNFQINANLFRHLLRLPVEYFEKRSIGDITTRFGSLGPIESFISSGIIAIVLDGIMALATLTMALTYSYKLTLIMLVFMVVSFLIELVVFPYRRQMSEKIIELTGKEQSSFIENIQAATTIKIFGQESVRENIWLNRKADRMNSSISLANFDIHFGSFSSILGGVKSAVILFVSAHLVISGNFSVGMLFAYQAYSGQFAGRVGALFSQVLAFKMLGMHMERLADIVHTAPEKGYGSENTFELADRVTKHDIALKNVKFRYADDAPLVLKGVSLDIKEGSMVSIIGASGQGKSTLLKVMLGLLPATEGRVLYGGMDLTHLNPTKFRKKIGVVMQEDKLLSGSIADNICFFDPEKDMEKIKHCAKLACLDKDVESSPMGYNTLVGELGSTLSGGQKQRLLLARALYRNPKYIFLDEGTANLDQQTEMQIAKTIRSLNKTRIVIAHRPALVDISDYIFELKDGHIYDVTEAYKNGSYGEVMREDG